MNRTPIPVTDIFFSQLSKGHRLTADNIMDRVKQQGSIETALFKTKMRVGDYLLFVCIFKSRTPVNAPIPVAEMSLTTLLLSDLERLEEEFVFMRYIPLTAPNAPLIPQVMRKDEFLHTVESDLMIHSAEGCYVKTNLLSQFEKPAS